jgi:hypothetical protein
LVAGWPFIAYGDQVGKGMEIFIFDVSRKTADN